jgi:predicted PurR-regulated permease PerM
MPMNLLGTVVEWGELGRTVAAAAAAGVGVALIFSVAVFGAAQWLELRRESRRIASVAAAGLTIVAVAGFAAAIVVGLVVMTDK